VDSPHRAINPAVGLIEELEGAVAEAGQLSLPKAEPHLSGAVLTDSFDRGLA
jgi:hypothetical protein